MMNILNGGQHADNNVDVQEFMVMPVGAKCFSEALRMGAEVFHALKSVLKKQGLNTSVGDEGGFAPSLGSNVEAIEVILKAIKAAGYKEGKDIWLALDCASSEYYKDKKYVLSAEAKPELTAGENVQFLADWARQYPIISIEDGMAEGDWAGWKQLTDALGGTVQLSWATTCSSRTRSTSPRYQEGINSILVKVNQIGTLSETLMPCRWRSGRVALAVIPHRSGETEGLDDRGPWWRHAGQIDRVASRSDRLPNTTSCAQKNWATRWNSLMDAFTIWPQKQEIGIIR